MIRNHNILRTRNNRQTNTQINRRFRHLHTTCNIHIRIRSSQMDSNFLLQNRHQQIHPVKIRSYRSTPRNSKITLTHQSLNLHQDRPRPLHRTRNHRPRRILRSSIQQKLRRILHFLKPRITHLKHTNLIGRTKTILHSPQNTIRSMSVPFKIKNRIHHMLQNPRACHISLFRHMTNDKNGHTHPLCDLHQDIRRFPYLWDTSRRRADILMKHRLNRVDHNHIRLLPFDHLMDHFQIRLTQKLHLLIKFPDPVRPQLNLPQRLLSGNIKNRNLFLCQIPAHLQQQRRFTNSGIPAH